ncbi:MAG: hypothetical protein IJ197_04900 [Bacteroidaceae bacterium]|nr:hypothetical protein [Bacteroidaceae bacterium]
MKLTYIKPEIKCMTSMEEPFMSNVSKFQIGEEGTTTDIEDVDPDDIIITTKQDKLWDDAWE